MASALSKASLAASAGDSIVDAAKDRNPAYQSNIVISWMETDSGDDIKEEIPSGFRFVATGFSFDVLNYEHWKYLVFQIAGKALPLNTHDIAKVVAMEG